MWLLDARTHLTAAAPPPAVDTMTRILWGTIFLISGSLFTFGAGESNSTIIEASISIDANSEAWISSSDTNSSANTTTSGTVTANTTTSSTVTAHTTTSSTVTANTSTSSTVTANTTTSSTVTANTTTSSTVTANTSTSSTVTANTSTSSTVIATTNATTHATTTTTIPPVKKFVAAAVRSHFDDCPDSHRHFCFHGTCRFLILEDTPACVCHQGFVGMRCEHADLLAVVATNHRQQTVATVLVLCVIGCVLIMLLCTLLHCWWRQDCRRRSRAHHYVTEKHGASCYPSESVV